MVSLTSAVLPSNMQVASVNSSDVGSQTAIVQACEASTCVSSTLFMTVQLATSIVSVGPSTPSFSAPSTNGATLESMATVMSTGSFTGTYSLTTANINCASTDNASFAISGSNLNFAAALGAGTYHICVRATQAGATNSPFDTAFTITGSTGVLSSISLSNGTTTDNVASGTSVGTLSVTMTPRSPIFAGYSSGGLALSTSGATSGGTCTTTNGAGNSHFQIVNDQLKTNGTVPSGTYSICVAATQ